MIEPINVGGIEPIATEPIIVEPVEEVIKLDEKTLQVTTTAVSFVQKDKLVRQVEMLNKRKIDIVRQYQMLDKQKGRIEQEVLKSEELLRNFEA